MNTSMIVYRLFDVADEIDLDLVQALWTSRNKIASRLRLDRISTKSITFKDPPVLVELGSHDMKLGNGTYLTLPRLKPAFLIWALSALFCVFILKMM